MKYKYYIVYLFIALIICKVLYNYNFDNNIILKVIKNIKNCDSYEK